MNPNPLFPASSNLGLNTDLYELTMAAAFWQAGMADETVTFELFTRELPESRNFLIAAGLEQALHFVLNCNYSRDTLAYLRELEIFRSVDSGFFDYLETFRFSGDVWALPEGTPFFPNQPIVQVTGPIIEAQILETYLMNCINVQSMVASKAARLCIAAGGKPIIDFGGRRAHGPQTAVLAARAAYLGGCAGTSNVLAGYELAIPVFGTMAHSFVQFFDRERRAFREFNAVFPDNTTLVVDTYDSLEGIKNALSLGSDFQGIRLDSGDLASLANQARRLLDEAGRQDVRIFASGDLNEETLQALSVSGTPIDGYGLGTELVTSADAPTCDLVYKLVELKRGDQKVPKFKTSKAKSTLPFRKQVCRFSRQGRFVGDEVRLWNESLDANGNEYSTLLKPYIEGGSLIVDLPDLSRSRELFQEQLSRFPENYRSLETVRDYPVDFSSRLTEALPKSR